MKLFIFLAQGVWRVLISLLHVAAWMTYVAWDDRPYMRPVMLFFAGCLSVAQALVIACDVAERQNTRDDLSVALASNARLTKRRLRTEASDGSLAPVPVPRRDVDSERGRIYPVRSNLQPKKSPTSEKLNVFELARFALTPAFASPVLHGDQF